MFVTMHQPEHMPWLGFFHKMAQAELYVCVDTVQYRHKYFQNRNHIAGPDGPVWLNVPVLKACAYYGPIKDVRIDNSREWRKTYWGSLRHAYQRHPHFGRYAEPLEAIVMGAGASLVDLNLALIDLMREALGITTPMVRASHHAPVGLKTDMILSLCEQVGATTYLSGPSGRDYLDEPRFGAAGVKLAYHHFEHPRYAQRRRTGFLSHLSTLDLLMNHGPGSREILLSPAMTVV